MNNKLIILNLLEEERITFEEALQLLSIESEDKPSYNREENPKIELNLIFERADDV